MSENSPTCRNRPCYLPAAWPEVERRIRRARFGRAGRVILLTDFDGTLVGMRPRPEQVRLPPAMRRRLAQIARDGVVVGVLSGRRLADVRARVGMDGIWYAGEHGYFLAAPGGRAMCLAGRKNKSRMARVHRLLARRLKAIRGVWVEAKDLTVAVHYRDASAENTERARRIVHNLLEKESGLQLMQSKKIWEILPGEGITKWSAVRAILRLTRARRRGSRLLFYLGDDQTDERVFEKMKGISVAVGRRPETAAHFYLRSPRDVAWFLDRLAAALKPRIRG